MPEVEWLPEGSSQTFKIGAPVEISGGYVVQHVSSANSEIYGFALKDGANGATDGASKSMVARVTRGGEFVGSYDGVLSASQLGLATFDLALSGSTWYVNTSSDTAQVRIKAPALGYAVGDTDPLVIFTVLDACIQEVD
jgi:hypothetical protein